MNDLSELPRLLQAAIGAAAFVYVFVLPGFGLEAICARFGRWGSVTSETPTEPRAIVFVRAFAVSILTTCALGYVLLAAGWFSAVRVSLLILPLSVAGTRPMTRWTRGLVDRWVELAVILISAAPFALVLLRDGHAPANGFNWYYWDLGRVLDAQGGVPTWVTEYGARVRFHPDYLSFNILTEAFQSSTVGIGAVQAIEVWRVALPVLTIALTYALFRLWLPRVASLTGVGLLTATVLITFKLGNGRPEILGFAVGMACVLLGVDALRRRRPRQYLLAGALVAVSASIHAIGALVPTILLAVATVVEILSSERGHRRTHIVTVSMTGLLALVIVGTTGWALQGRAFVAGDANNPQASGEYDDPTYAFVELADGRLEPRDPPDVWDAIAGSVTEPWGDLAITEGAGRLVVVGIALSPVIALAVGDRRIRQGVLTTLGVTGVLIAGATWFGTQYETFIPRHTGLSRFLQWSPFIYSMMIAAGIAAVEGRVHRRLAAGGDQDTHRGERLAWSCAAGACVVLAVGLGVQQSQRHLWSSRTLDAEHVDALRALDDEAQPGDVVLANPTTRGIIEYTTGAEVPLEGRQPLIEEPDVLQNSLDFISMSILHFSEPLRFDGTSTTGASLVMVTDDADGIAAFRTYGGTPDDFVSAGIGELRYRSEHVAIIRVASPAEGSRFVGPARTTKLKTTIAFIVVAITLAAALAATRRFGPTSSTGESARPTRASSIA